MGVIYNNIPPVNNESESVRVLRECIELQVRKSADYQNPASSVKQAHHYRRGVATIFDMIDQKMRRAQSIIETMEANPLSVGPNFESLEDTFKDIVNYSSFAVSYLRGKMAGQLPARDALNRAKPLLASPGVAPGASGLPQQFLVEGGNPVPTAYVHTREQGDVGC